MSDPTLPAEAQTQVRGSIPRTAQQRGGYRLWPAEAIWQQVMALGLPSMAAFSVEILPEIDSTNTELMRRARAGRLEPTLLVAEHQSAGRGRMGRDWQSEPGHSLTFSFGCSLSPQQWEGLSLAVGTSLAGSLGQDTEPRIRLKWPNDLWWQERKLAGILIETAPVSTFGAAAPAERYVVIGIGVNIDEPPPSQPLRTAAAWLRELQPEATAASVLLRIFRPLLQDVLEFERSGFAAFSQRFAACDALKGREVVLSDGRSGQALGVDASGALLVHTSQGVQRVASLEVSVRPQASA
jgi:BirA family transcriptional regulator, biotin operon repressor / biotin---[acetyl-CoA-carboxylase] ligase